MPTAPNSLITTAVPRPSGVLRNRCTSVVLPAPRKPVTTVTGMRAPRARFCRRPNGPASREGKRSSMLPCPGCGAARSALVPPARLRASSTRYGGAPLIRDRHRLGVWNDPGSAAHHCAPRGATCCAGPGTQPSEIHLQDVEPAGVAVDAVDDLALVDEHVVDLDRAGGREGR